MFNFISYVGIDRLGILGLLLLLICAPAIGLIVAIAVAFEAFRRVGYRIRKALYRALGSLRKLR